METCPLPKDPDALLAFAELMPKPRRGVIAASNNCASVSSDPSGTSLCRGSGWRRLRLLRVGEGCERASSRERQHHEHCDGTEDNPHGDPPG